MAENENTPIDKIPVSNNIAGAFILGTDANNKTKNFPVSIFQLETDPNALLLRTDAELFNISSSDITPGEYINSAGGIGTAPGSGYSTSPWIPVEELQRYILNGLTNGQVYSIRFENSSNALVHFLNPSSFPAIVDIPATVVRIKFTCKQPTDSAIPSLTSFKMNVSKIIGKANLPIQADILAPGATQDGKSLINEDTLPLENLSINLFNPANIVPTQAIDSAGDIQPYPNYATSGYINVTAGQRYTIDGLPSTNGVSVLYSIRFENSSNVKIGFQNPFTFPYSFIPPSGTTKVKFTIKDPSDSAIPSNVFFGLSSSYKIAGKGAPLEAGKISNDTTFFDVLLSYYIGKGDVRGLKLFLYGSSITVDYSPGYQTANYPRLMKLKTGAASVQWGGWSGGAYAGDLMLDSNLSSIIAAAPDVLVIESPNDHRVGTPVGTTASLSGEGSVAGGLKHIFEYLINALPNLKIYLCTPTQYGDVKSSGFPNSFGSNEKNSINKFLPEYRSIMIDICAMYGVSVIDLTTKCGFRPQVESTSNRVFTWDGVHPSLAGYERMTDIISQALNRGN